MIVNGGSRIVRSLNMRWDYRLSKDARQPTSLPPIEPSADIRKMAGFCRQFYVALLAQGFTEDQSLEIVGNAVRGATAGVDLSQ